MYELCLTGNYNSHLLNLYINKVHTCSQLPNDFILKGLSRLGKLYSFIYLTNIVNTFLQMDFHFIRFVSWRRCPIHAFKWVQHQCAKDITVTLTLLLGTALVNIQIETAKTHKIIQSNNGLTSIILHNIYICFTYHNGVVNLFYF